MNRYAALLRGIAPNNPNMRNDRVRGVFEELGLERVTSVLASGNILFRSDDDVPALEERIEEALRDRLGIGGGTIIREHSELRGLLDSDPFPGLVHGRDTYLIATFLKDRGQATHPLPDGDWGATRLVGHDPAAGALLAVVDNSDPSRTRAFMAWQERAHGKAITTRSWLTVQRIVARLED